MWMGLLPCPVKEFGGRVPAYKVMLQDFEGPLDLLLFLIRENEIDIYDIPIVAITRQYLQYMEQIDEVDLDLAGDFILMSATLLQIKARMLLPREQQQEEESEDPRRELVERLLEYRQFREISERLQDLEHEMRGIHPRRYFNLDWVEPETRDESLQDVSLFDLACCFAEMQERPRGVVTHDVELFRFTVEDQIRSIRDRLREQACFPLGRVIDDPEDRNLMVVSFLAVLDLARHQEVIARQHNPRSEIWLFDPRQLDDWLRMLRESA